MCRGRCNCPLCHYARLFCYPFLLEYRDAFALFDKRGDGKIDSDQIGDVMRALGLNPTEAEVKKIVQEIGEVISCFLVCKTSTTNSLSCHCFFNHPVSPCLCRYKTSHVWGVPAHLSFTQSKERARLHGGFYRGSTSFWQRWKWVHQFSWTSSRSDQSRWVCIVKYKCCLISCNKHVH